MAISTPACPRQLIFKPGAQKRSQLQLEEILILQAESKTAAGKGRTRAVAALPVRADIDRPEGHRRGTK